MRKHQFGRPAPTPADACSADIDCEAAANAGDSAVRLLAVDDADRAAPAGRLERHDPRPRGEDRVVAAEAGAIAGPEAGAALADDDLAAVDALPGEHLDAEHLRVRVATVAAGAEPLL